MRIIAFDLGKNFAWAHNVRPKKVFAEHCILKGETRAHRLGDLNRFLTDYFYVWQSGVTPFEIAVYETPFARGRDATRSLWGIAGLIEACASNAGLPVVDVAVPTIKKFATGSGRASKEEMIAAAKKFGYKGGNEHEADSVCLLRYAEANMERVSGINRS